MSKSLVVYYSLQGHTKQVAEIISKNLNADIVRLAPRRNYNVATALTIGRAHINNKHMPKLKPIELNIDDYDQIFIGTPVWWYTFTPPIRTFVNQFNLSGKSVSFFSTHQGANGSTFKDLKELVGDANVEGAKDFFSGGSCDWQQIAKDIHSWLNS